MATGTKPRRARASTHRWTGPTHGMRRRQPEPGGLKKVMAAVLPTAAAKKATPSSKKGKAGGFALVAAAAGMAFKNRGRIAQMRHKDSNGSAPPSTPTA